MLLGPVVHPWYLLWAAIPLAATRGMPRHRRAALAASALLAVMLPPTGADFAFRSFQLPLAILAGIVILVGRAAGRAAGAARGSGAGRRGRCPTPSWKHVRPAAVGDDLGGAPLDDPTGAPGVGGSPHARNRRPAPGTEIAGPPSPTGPPHVDRTLDFRVREPAPARRPDPGPAEPPVVAVRGLVKRYGPVTAVDGLDLALAPASVLALLGPNGAGKSTTVEVCTGFATADAGEVRVLGTDPAGAPDALRARIGVMPQGGGAYPGVRAGEMLRLVAACAARPAGPGLADRRARACGGCARTPYKRLSGGQQQRLALACAIVGRPELVFLDEPTAGLDPQGRRLVWELVDALRRDGVAVLLTTHLMEEAEALADHVVIVDHGRVVARGQPDGADHGRRPGAAVPRPTRDGRGRAWPPRCPPATAPRRRWRAATSCRAASTPRCCRRSPAGARRRARWPTTCRSPGRSLEDVS